MNVDLNLRVTVYTVHIKHPIEDDCTYVLTSKEERLAHLQDLCQDNGVFKPAKTEGALVRQLKEALAWGGCEGYVHLDEEFLVLPIKGKLTLNNE